MPLMPGRSKKAFSKNVETEMEHGKPQDQALAIAYSVKRKNKKKMASGGSVQSGSPDMNYAKGGMVNDSAASEKRPMPEEIDKDQEMVSKNSGNKPPKNDHWTDNPTVAQAQKNNGRAVLPIKRPKMVPSDAFSTRMYDEEADLQSSAGVNEGPQRQPPQHDNEEGANRQGPKVSDMESQHNNKRAPYKMAVEDQYSEDEAEPNMKQRYAAGGMIIDEDREEARERSDEAHLQSMASPSEDEGDMFANARNEEDQDRSGNAVPDMEHEHSNGRKVYAEGGEVEDSENISEEARKNAEDLQKEYRKHEAQSEGTYAYGGEVDPEEEMAIDHAASIAAAIMAKRKFARGGAILSEDSMESFPEEDQADLERNAEEDANMEDKASFDALRKENYSESDALEESSHPEDSNLHSPEHDEEDVNDRSIVSAIRSKMKKRSPISR